MFEVSPTRPEHGWVLRLPFPGELSAAEVDQGHGQGNAQGRTRERRASVFEERIHRRRPIRAPSVGGCRGVGSVSGVVEARPKDREHGSFCYNRFLAEACKRPDPLGIRPRDFSGGRRDPRAPGAGFSDRFEVGGAVARLFVLFDGLPLRESRRRLKFGPGAGGDLVMGGSRPAGGCLACFSYSRLHRDGVEPSTFEGRGSFRGRGRWARRGLRRAGDNAAGRPNSAAPGTTLERHPDVLAVRR